MNVVWLPEADADIQRRYGFLLQRDPKAAGKAVRAIRDGSQELVEYPKVGRPMDDETGRREQFVPFGAGAYVLRYLVLDDRVVVIRVWHSREKRCDRLKLELDDLWANPSRNLNGSTAPLDRDGISRRVEIASQHE